MAINRLFFVSVEETSSASNVQIAFIYIKGVIFYILRDRVTVKTILIDHWRELIPEKLNLFIDIYENWYQVQCTWGKILKFIEHWTSLNQ